MAKQKRKKKHDPNKLLRPLRALADNFIVFSIDGISSGVKSAGTLQTVRISMTEHDVLTKFKHKYRFAVGSAWRDEYDKDHFTYTVADTATLYMGNDITPTLLSMAREHGREVGKSNFLTTFYFATTNMNYDFSDEVVWKLLNMEGTWSQLITWREYVINEAITMNKHIKKTKLDETQVGGWHYCKLEIQPRHVIVPLQLPWDLGNAIKYVIRHQDKNGRQDLMKAWDYVARMRADGQASFPQRRLLKSHKELFAKFIAQFNDDTQTVLNAMWQVYCDKITSTEQFNEGMSAILFEINQLCKAHYGANAYDA